MKKTTEAKATARVQKRELRALKTARKQSTRESLKALSALRKQADRLVASHQENDAKFARRIAILETRLS